MSEKTTGEAGHEGEPASAAAPAPGAPAATEEQAQEPAPHEELISLTAVLRETPHTDLSDLVLQAVQRGVPLYAMCHGLPVKEAYVVSDGEGRERWTSDNGPGTHYTGPLRIMDPELAALAMQPSASLRVAWREFPNMAPRETMIVGTLELRRERLLVRSGDARTKLLPSGASGSRHSTDMRSAPVEAPSSSGIDGSRHSWGETHQRSETNYQLVIALLARGLARAKAPKGLGRPWNGKDVSKTAVGAIVLDELKEVLGPDVFDAEKIRGLTSAKGIADNRLQLALLKDLKPALGQLVIDLVRLHLERGEAALAAEVGSRVPAPARVVSGGDEPELDEAE